MKTDPIIIRSDHRSGQARPGQLLNVRSPERKGLVSFSAIYLSWSLFCFVYYVGLFFAIVFCSGIFIFFTPYRVPTWYLILV